MYIYNKVPSEEPIKDDPISKPEIKNGTVIVHYINTDGETISKDEIITGEVGKEYETTKKTIDGYDYKTVVGTTLGNIIEGKTEVIYIYSKNNKIINKKTSIMYKEHT